MIDMIRLIVSDHRFEPILIARCTLCDWSARYGKVIALATVIARSQDHVQQQHHGESRPADEVGLPGVTDRVGVAGIGVEVCAYDGYEWSDPHHLAVHDPAVAEWLASDQGKRVQNVLRS